MMFRVFRPIIIGILLFILINGAVTVAVNHIPSLREELNLKADNLLPYKLQEIAKIQPQNLDVLFLGTSQTNDGFSTHAFDEAFPEKVRSFNMGLPGSAYGVILSYLKVHITHYGKPKLVLLEVSDLLAQKDDDHFYVPMLQYKTLINQYPSLFSDFWKNPLLSFKIRKELFFSMPSAIYEFRPLFSPLRIQSAVTKGGSILINKTLQVLFHINTPIISQEAEAHEQVSTSSEHFQDDQTLPMGWTPRDMIPMLETPGGVKTNARLARNYYIGHVTQPDFTNLIHLLNYCQQEKINVVLVSWPNHPDYDKLFQKTPFSKPFYTGVQQIVQQYHLPYINMEEGTPYQLTQFYSDTRHLNAQGAIIFSRLLAQKLAVLPQVKALFQNKPIQVASAHKSEK